MPNPFSVYSGASGVALGSPLAHTISRIDKIAHKHHTQGPGGLTNIERALYNSALFYSNGPKVLALKLGEAFKQLGLTATKISALNNPTSAKTVKIINDPSASNGDGQPPKIPFVKKTGGNDDESDNSNTFFDIIVLPGQVVLDLFSGVLLEMGRCQLVLQSRITSDNPLAEQYWNYPHLEKIRFGFLTKEQAENKLVNSAAKYKVTLDISQKRINDRVKYLEAIEKLKSLKLPKGKTVLKVTNNNGSKKDKYYTISSLTIANDKVPNDELIQISAHQLDPALLAYMDGLHLPIYTTSNLIEELNSSTLQSGDGGGGQHKKL